MSDQSLKISQQAAQSNKHNSGLAFHFGVDKSIETREIYRLDNDSGEDLEIVSPKVTLEVDQGAINKVTGIKIEDGEIVFAKVILVAKDFVNSNTSGIKPQMFGKLSSFSIKDRKNDTFIGYDYYFLLIEDFNSKKELVMVCFDIDLEKKECDVKQYFYGETLMLESNEWTEASENSGRKEQFENFRKLYQMLQDKNIM
ncbi:hypothetical protein JZO86_11950 [Enterococcus ureasiticus]|uniref:hypothetical protein n=1 Tax=Enterococcus ureasiticus TaxID=903984 RepID=UPI001A8C5021|nr:hypothetical protein [Enterococcus ureasiticus]MBO0474412.1 hypothetical protein [Enterococcus ureasiticus]